MRRAAPVGHRKGAFGQSQCRLSSAVQEPMVFQCTADLLPQIDIDPISLQRNRDRQPLHASLNMLPAQLSAAISCGLPAASAAAATTPWPL